MARKAQPISRNAKGIKFVTLSLPVELVFLLDKEARDHNRTRSNYVAWVLTNELSRLKK